MPASEVNEFAETVIAVGGLMVSQLLTLYITLAVYVLFVAFGTWIGAGRRESIPASEVGNSRGCRAEPRANGGGGAGKPSQLTVCYAGHR